MKDAELIRSIIRLRSTDRPADEVIARLGKAELASQPEATIVAIVRGYYEFKSNGYADADIYREIQGRRQQVYGEEPLPADLTLDNYTRYRMRLEYPNQPALHDPIFVMQAVHRARAALEKEYGPEGMPVTFRTMPWVNNLLLVYAAIVGITQGGRSAAGLGDPRFASTATPELWLLIGAAAAVVIAAVGFVGKAAWGRTALLAALVLEAVLPWAAIAMLHPVGMIGSSVDAWLQSLNTILIVGFLAYLYRRPDSRPAAA